MPRPVTTLPNLGPRCADWLEQIGICSAEDLQEVGYAAAYQQLVASGVTTPHRMLLYALAGAVTGRSCIGLSREEKREIEEVAGLR
jgi:hypothetical protein